MSELNVAEPPTHSENTRSFSDCSAADDPIPSGAVPARRHSRGLGTRWFRLSILVLALGGGGWTWWSSQSHSPRGIQVQGELVWYTVERADLPVNVVERGTLASQRETRITCDVETVPGQSGTRILSIVPNGTPVKQGDLLVEFDAAPLRERLNTQSVVFEQAKATKIQALARYENQITQNETNLATAELRVQTAELALKMYEDGEDGTYHIALRDLEQRVQEAQNQIAEALAALTMKAASRRGVELLFKLGYRGKGDLNQAVHDHLQADFALIRATNALANALANRKKSELYERPLKLLELNGAIATALRAREQAGRDNESLLAQANAAKTAAERALITEEERLHKYEEQLVKCRVTAPHDGLVAHSPDRTPWGRFVADGELVSERFKIMSLPDLTRMQVKTAVHESVLDQVKPGLKATVSVDAFPELSYQGTVLSVAVLPTQEGNYSSDVKVYDAIVTIDEPVDQLKPGMTAVSEIHVTRLNGVLTLPLQAVVQEEDQTYCYVAGDEGLARRTVQLGEMNEAFVEVRQGLDQHEQVVLNSVAVLPTEALPRSETQGADVEIRQVAASPSDGHTR